MTRPLPLLLPGPPMWHLLDGPVSLLLRRKFLIRRRELPAHAAADLGASS